MKQFSIFNFLVFSLALLITSSCSEQKPENTQELTSKKEEPKTETKKKKSLKLLKKQAEILPIELVDKLVESYFKLKDNLVNNNTKLAQSNAKKIVAILAEYKEIEVSYPLTAVQETAYEISQIKDLTLQREYFRPLSTNLYKIILETLPSKPLYLQHCPMAFNGGGADWLSSKKKVENPYYGKDSEMFTCGTSKTAIARM
jgi:hypothetical protein